MNRERILLGGPAGSGKTYGWLTIARFCPEAMFYVIDPDDGVERVWQAEFPDVSNVDLLVVNSWGDVEAALAHIKKEAKIGDWVIAEMLMNLWRMVREHFIAEIWGQEMGAYYLQRRQEQQDKDKKALALHTPQDWDVMNKLYTDFITTVCYRMPAHVLATTSISLINSQDPEELREYLRAMGSNIRFEGQRHDVFKFHTLLQLSHDQDGYYLSTLGKDRGRDPVDRVPLACFALNYLARVAGWEFK